MTNQQGIATAAILTLILLSPPALLMYSFLLPGEEWDNSARVEGNSLLFEPHYQFHPSHYDFEDKRHMFADISIINMTVDPQHLGTIPGFFKIKNQTLIGSMAPDFNLKTTQSDNFQLSSGRGKISAFMFVALTCPPALMQTPEWGALRKRYSPEKVNLFLIYSRERHPGEPGFPDYTHTTSDSEKMANAKLMANITDLPIVVDTIEEHTLKSYGELPNSAFVVDREGIVVFKSSWADAQKVQYVIDGLLSFYQD